MEMGALALDARLGCLEQLGKWDELLAACETPLNCEPSGALAPIPFPNDDPLELWSHPRWQVCYTALLFYSEYYPS